MPKLTITGKELGASETGAIVLDETAFNTNQEVLEKHRDAINGVERIENFRYPKALRRGNHFEGGVASWTLEELQIANPESKISMFEPKNSFQRTELKMGASIDRIIEVAEVPIVVLDTQDEPFAFIGTGIVEIKTDYYHKDRIKPEWLIQIHHQMICAGLDWGMIACADQKGHLNIYPIKRNERLCETIINKVNIFWGLIESGEDYPPIAKPKDKEFVDVKDLLKDSNRDLLQLASDYNKASSEARMWTKTKNEIKEAISDVLDALNVTHAVIDNFEITSEYKKKEKKKQVATGEFAESHSFSIKEKNS